MKKLIYLASAYSDADASVVARRVRQVQTATAKLIERGFLVFSPIVHSHPIAELIRFSPLNTAEAQSAWMDFDKSFIEHCDELWVLTTPGYKESRGVKAEVEFATEIGLPIRFVSYPNFEPSIFAYVLDGDTLKIYVGDTDAQVKIPNAIALDNELTPEGAAFVKELIEEQVDTALINAGSGDAGAALGGIINRPTIYGAGKFSTPKSTGKPPLKPIDGDEAERILSRIFGEDEPAQTCDLGIPDCDCTHRVKPPTEVSWKAQGPEDFGGEDFPSAPNDFGKVDDFLGVDEHTIIGLNGHAQVGKDTVGEFLVRKHGFVRVSFADAVRDCLYALNPVVFVREDEPLFAQLIGRPDLAACGVDRGEGRVFVNVRTLVDTFGWDKAKQVENVRRLLQRQGTEVGRDIISPTIWLDIAQNKIADAYPRPVVITDVRFENEAAFVKALNGQVVRVNRRGTGPINGHPSDATLDDSFIDVEIHNDYFIRDLYAQVESKVLAYE